MDEIKEIQAKITRLSSDEFARLRDWLDEYLASRWDEQFEQDVGAGRLDKIAEESLKHFKNGKCTEL